MALSSPLSKGKRRYTKYHSLWYSEVSQWNMNIINLDLMALGSNWFVIKIPLQKQNVSKHKSFRSSHQRCSIKKDVIKKFAKFTGKHLFSWCLQLFSCELCEKFKNTFFTEHFRTTASNPSTPSSSFIKKPFNWLAKEIHCLETLVGNGLGITIYST